MDNVCRTRTDIRNRKSVKIAQQVKKNDMDMDNRNYGCTAANQQTNNMIIPIWKKMNLTIEEAAAYSNIGITKLYEITNNPICSFVFHVGNRKRLIKYEDSHGDISSSTDMTVDA